MDRLEKELTLVDQLRKELARLQERDERRAAFCGVGVLDDDVTIVGAGHYLCMDVDTARRLHAMLGKLLDSLDAERA